MTYERGGSKVGCRLNQSDGGTVRGSRGAAGPRGADGHVVGGAFRHLHHDRSAVRFFVHQVQDHPVVSDQLPSQDLKLRSSLSSHRWKYTFPERSEPETRKATSTEPCMRLIWPVTQSWPNKSSFSGVMEGPRASTTAGRLRSSNSTALTIDELAFSAFVEKAMKPAHTDAITRKLPTYKGVRLGRRGSSRCDAGTVRDFSARRARSLLAETGAAMIWVGWRTEPEG